MAKKTHRAGSIRFIPRYVRSDLNWVTLSYEEKGRILEQMITAHQDNDSKSLSELQSRFNFIEKFYIGTITKRPSISPKIRKEVLSIGKCKYCDSTKNLTVDHIIPYSKGGSHSIENFQCLCRSCNRAKYFYTEEEYFKRLENVR